MGAIFVWSGKLLYSHLLKKKLISMGAILRASHIEEDSFPLLPYKRELKKKEYHQLNSLS